MKKTLVIDGVPVTYTDEGAGQPFVLVHGAGANRNYWQTLSAELRSAAGGAHVLAPDLYGHGDAPPWRPTRTNAPHRSVYAYADDVAMLESLASKIDEPFALVGHSSGGAVCLEYTLRHPERVRQLVIAEPMLPGLLAASESAWTEVASAYGRVHTAVDNGDHEAAARQLFTYILGDGEWQKLPEGTRCWMTDHVAGPLVAHSKASLSLRLDAGRYRAIACPLLVLHGERTRGPFQRICELVAAAVPGSRIAVVAEAGHNAPLTHAAVVNQMICSFLWRD